VVAYWYIINPLLSPSGCCGKKGGDRFVVCEDQNHYHSAYFFPAAVMAEFSTIIQSCASLNAKATCGERSCTQVRGARKIVHGNE